ncbi:hypothetical protein E2C01_035484 [Portunus trituberculatus]|uniref:Uncharacterized protein n=1 Tax=Portunus trituberculatus TaxID=210409 RepID=A0A5B7F8K7_PORTR|nr:hypothetical protein [Portunus trituberculatus]
MNKVLRISSKDRSRNNGFKLEKFRFKTEWEGTGSLTEWLINGTDSAIGNFKIRLDKFMDGDDKWN